MAAVAPNSLFADCDCGTGPQPAKCKHGRGATPRREHTVELDRPNFSGRRKLVFRYRPLKRWQSWQVVTGHDGLPRVEVADQLELVERGVVYYFQKIGGFRTADDRIVRLFYEALEHFADEAAELDVTPARLMTWVIDAKAESLRAEAPDEAAFKRAFIGHPDGFLEPSRLDTWLDKSKHCCNHRVKLRAKHRAEADEQHAHDLASRAQAERAAAEADRERIRQGYAARITQDDRRLLEFWKTLARDRQYLALGAVHEAWKRLCADCKEKPYSDLMQDLLRIHAAKWARDAWPDQSPERERRAPDQSPECKRRVKESTDE